MTPFIDMGWYRRRDGRRTLLTYWPASKAVTLDGPGGVQFLGFITTEDQARRVFEGWADEDGRPEAWVHARMLAAATDGLLACPDCAGTGRQVFPDPFQRGGLIEAVCPTCATVMNP